MVDDQPAKLLTYEAMLQGSGQTLLKAHTARQALACLLQEEVAVVLLDVNMPELDGFELAGMIRGHPRCRRTAIIFVSAVSLTDADRLRGYEIGGVDYVSVPVIPEILRAKVGVFVDLYNKTMELETLNRTLEERVSERTAKLEDSIAQLRASEMRLRQQSEALEEEGRRKNIFLAMLAHELRNPLQPICMALDLERAAPAGSPAFAGGRQIIERQVSQLVRLVDDLLDASRITSGKLELRRAPAELAPIVAAAADAVRPLADQKRQELSIEIPTEPVKLFCDGARLTQVFLNLLNNAVKYTPSGGRIKFAATHDADEVRVVVSDNGMGVEESERFKIFEMFYQGANEPTATHTGLGLGLALVKQLVDLHGGAVDVRSPGPGQGSEFSLRLPVLQQAMDASASPTVESPPRPRAGPRRILVIDDNRDAADSFAALLCADGAAATAIYGGGEAVDALARYRPDVIFLDLGMPGIDGYQTARAIRSDPRGGEVVLIALTGWGGADIRRRTEDAGFDLHLVKPVFPADLLAIVASAERSGVKASQSGRGASTGH